MKKMILCVLLALIIFSAGCSWGKRRATPLDVSDMYVWTPDTGSSSCTDCVFFGVNYDLSSKTRVALDIIVRDVQNFQSAFFDLQFNTSFLDYYGFAEGDLLNQNGDPTSVLVELDGLDPSIVTMGGAVMAAGVEVSAPPEGLSLLTLYFDIVEKGTSSLDFLNGPAPLATGFEDSANNPVPATWYAGDLTVY